MNEAKLGGKVRSLRRRHGWSQARLARELGISSSYLNLIEHNKRRLSADLMFKVAMVLDIDVRTFASDDVASLHGELMDVLADPLLEADDIKAADVRDLAENHPGVSQVLVRLYRKHQSSHEAMENLGALMLDGAALQGINTSRLPSEEVNDLVQRHMNHFPKIEAVAEQLWESYRVRQASLFDGLSRILEEELEIDLRIMKIHQTKGVMRQYDPRTRTLMISEALAPRSRNFHLAHQIGLHVLDRQLEELLDDPQITTEESRKLAKMVLANYFAGAMLMPYQRFYQAAEAERYDVELLGHRFRVSFEQVCHRLTTLRRPGMEGIPFHLVKTDTAGNISKRFSASGIQFARFSGGCPKWNVYRAFLSPGRIRVQLSEMPDGRSYFCIARTVTKRLGGFHAPETVHAIALGCDLVHTPRLIYADGLDIQHSELIKIGTNCRTCDRLSCDQRAFPSLWSSLNLDENIRRVAFYASEDRGETGSES